MPLGIFFCLAWSAMHQEINAASVREPLFDSAWLKWAQAIVHAEALQADIEARRSNGAAYPVLAFRTEYQPKRHGIARPSRLGARQPWTNAPRRAQRQAGKGRLLPDLQGPS